MLSFTEASAGRGGAPVVLHVVQSLRGGGAEAFVRELVPRLRHRGIDARVMCAYGTTQLTEAEASAWTGTVYCQQRNGLSKLQYLQRMRRSIHLISPDIVHTHTHVGAVWGRAAAVLARVPRIAHTEHRSVDRLPPLERAAIALLNSRTDVIVTFSERAAKLVRERERIRDLHVIPNGIRVRPLPSETDRRIARRKLDLDEKVVAVGMIANLYPHKNPFLGIDAIARLPAQSRGAIRLALFGDGPLRHALSARADELGVQALVRFYGFRTDIEQLLPGMDLILTTSPREMMPISLLESMNAALPIIGAPHAGTLDLVVDGETGLVLKSWDPGLFGEALEWAITHPEWRARAGSAAHLRLKKYFDIETVADRYVDLYQRMLHRNSG